MVQIYPLAWEVFVDDVFFDGEKLPRSTLSSPEIALSAIVDTVSSIFFPFVCTRDHWAETIYVHPPYLYPSIHYQTRLFTFIMSLSYPFHVLF